MSANVLPQKLTRIVGDFELAEGREKLEMLLDYSEILPPIPEELGDLKTQMEAVPECMTPVSIAIDLKDGGMYFYFRIPEDYSETFPYFRLYL